MKAKTITFPEKHESRLRELGVKAQFVYNLKNHSGFNEHEIKQFATNPPVQWVSFLEQAFVWHATPQGHYFWEDIAYHYEERLYDNYDWNNKNN